MARYAILVLPFCCLLILLLGCRQVTETPTPIPVLEMGLCSGWDSAKGELIGEATTFPSDASRIYVFARVVAHREYWYTLNWFYEESPDDHELLNQQVFKPVNGYVIGWIEPSEDQEFRPGKYLVDIVSTKTLLRTAEFEVK